MRQHLCSSPFLQSHPTTIIISSATSHSFPETELRSKPLAFSKGCPLWRPSALLCHFPLPVHSSDTLLYDPLDLLEHVGIFLVDPMSEISSIIQNLEEKQPHCHHDKDSFWPQKGTKGETLHSNPPSKNLLCSKAPSTCIHARRYPCTVQPKELKMLPNFSIFIHVFVYFILF